MDTCEATTCSCFILFFSFLEEEQVADDDQSVLLEDWTDDENDARSPIIHRQEINSFPERDGTLDMTDEEEKDIFEDSQKHTDHSLPVTEEIVPHVDGMKGLDFSHSRIEDSKNIPDLGITEHSEQSGSEELEKSTSCFPSTSHLSSPDILHTFHHLSLEEQMNNCGIETETSSEGVFSNIRVDSSYQSFQSEEQELKNKITPQISVKGPVMKILLEKTNHDGLSQDKLERSLRNPYHSHQLPTPSPRKTNHDSQDLQVSSRAQRFAKAKHCSQPPSPHRSSDKNNQRTSKTSHTDPDDVRYHKFNITVCSGLRK